MGPSKKISFLKGIALAAGATTLLSHFLPSSSPQPDPNAKVERDLSTVDFNHGLVVHDGRGYKTFFEKGGFPSDKYPQWHPVPMSEEAMDKCPNSITLPAKEGAKLDVYSFKDKDGIMVRDGQNFVLYYLYVGGGCSPGILLGAEEVKKTLNEFNSYCEDLQTDRGPDLSDPGAVAARGEDGFPDELSYTEGIVANHCGGFDPLADQQVKLLWNEERLLRIYNAWVQANARPDGTIPPELASTNATLRSVLEEERKWEHKVSAQIQRDYPYDIIGEDRGPNSFNCACSAVMAKKLFDRAGIPNWLCKGYITTKENIQMGHVFVVAESPDHRLYLIETTNREDIAQIIGVAALNPNLICLRTNGDRCYTILNDADFNPTDSEEIKPLQEALGMVQPSQTNAKDRKTFCNIGEQILSEVLNSSEAPAASIAATPPITPRLEATPFLRPDLPSVSRIDSNDYSDDQARGR